MAIDYETVGVFWQSVGDGTHKASGFKS
jgi:hypothetical protein